MPDTKPESQTAAVQTPAFRIPISVGAEVLVEFVNLNLRIKSVLVGIDHEQFLLVKIFQNDLIGTFRSEAVRASPVIFRYLYKGIVYGFRTETLNVVSTPEKLLFFAYPQKIDESHPLASDRRECMLPAITMLGNDIVEMTVVDISKNGCMCVIKTSGARGDALYKLMQVNKPVEIKMQIPGGQEKLAVAGKVRNIGKGEDRITVGVMFDEAGQAAEARISGFISLVTGAGKK